MKPNTSAKTAFAFFISIYFFGIACNNTETTERKETVPNKTELIDTSIQKLSKIINLVQHKPDSVKYRYIFHENSGNTGRASVPGPSDSYLEAVLYFKKSDFEKVQNEYSAAHASAARYKKEDFIFDWFNQAIKDEITNADTAVAGYDDNLFGNMSEGRVGSVPVSVMQLFPRRHQALKAFSLKGNLLCS